MDKKTAVPMFLGFICFNLNRKTPESG